MEKVFGKIALSDALKGVYFMILVDKDIKSYIQEGQLIQAGYQEENFNGISYDLTIGVICGIDEKENIHYDLRPGETVFVKTKEKLAIPLNILGRIAEKNSRMRQGLKVDGPHYQPGHVTFAFLRIQNISNNTIELSAGMRIAQIIFEELTNKPDVPYSEQTDAAFKDEENYRGLGSYKEEYDKQTKMEIEKAKEDIESVSHKIYANVLTIMGIIVAVFSLLSINYQAFSQAKLDYKYIITMNLTLVLCIVVLMGLILIFINKAKEKKFLFAYIVILALLVLLTVIVATVV